MTFSRIRVFARSTMERRPAPDRAVRENHPVGDDFESNAESLTPEPSTLRQATDTDTAADDMDSSAPSMTPEHRGARTPPDTETDLAADSLEPIDPTERDTNT